MDATTALPRRVRIVEVGPRDGLQNEPAVLPTQEKIALVRALAGAGLTEIEVTSFVHPRWIPNLADAEEVAHAVADLPIRAFALVPNRRGLDRAIAAGMPAVTLVMSATEGHNRANLNRSLEASLDVTLALQQEARRAGLVGRVSLSVVFGCPFEGRVPEKAIVEIVAALVGGGADRVSLCDTIGVAEPDQVHDLCHELRSSFPGVEFELHLHDTQGRALANTVAGLRAGIASFDTAVGGLGGCPYAPGATGNVSTERTVAMLDAMGIATGVERDRLVDARAVLASHFRIEPYVA